MAQPKFSAPEIETSDKWEAQMRKGCLEMAVLATLWHGRMYGLEILRVLKRDSRLVLAEGTIYPILNRLKSEGMLTSEWVEAEAGHPRKYYSLTEAGRVRLLQMAEAWESFAGGLSQLLEPVLRQPVLPRETVLKERGLHDDSRYTD